MLRVGYPAKLDPSFLSVMPQGIELIPLPDDLDHEVHLDVWIPDPLSNRAVRVWPHLSGVRLGRVIVGDAGESWIAARPLWAANQRLSGLRAFGNNEIILG